MNRSTHALLRDLIAESQNGLSKRRGDAGVLTPVLRLADISRGTVDESDPREIRLTEAELAKYALREGDLVCIRVNGSKGLVGRMIPFRAGRTWAYCDHFIRLRPKPELVDYRYLKHYFDSRSVRRRIELDMVSSAGQNTVSQGTMLNVGVPLPGLGKQRAIVSEIEKQFSRIDEAVAIVQRVNTNVERYKAAILTSAVSGRLVETEAHIAATQGRAYENGHELLQRYSDERTGNRGRAIDHTRSARSTKLASLPALPTGWAWATFADVADRITVGHVGPMKNEYVAAGIPFLRSQNVRPNRYEPKGLTYISERFHAELQKSALSPGDIVVVRSGSVGVTCVIPDNLSIANCSDLVIIKSPRAVLPEYGAYYLNSVVESRIAAGRVGIALAHFNTRSVAELPVPVPPLAEQRRIVAEVERRLSIVRELEAELDANLKRAQVLRQATLAKAFAQ